MPAPYNYEHFRTTHLLADAYRTMAGIDVKPGEVAPDFDLPTVDGGRFRLSEHRGRPVLFKFGSYS